MFPEGTRTVTRPLNRFRPGITLIAKLAQAPIQTVFIETDSPYLGKGWPIWRAPPLPIVFRVRLGQRFAPRARPPAHCWRGSSATSADAADSAPLDAERRCRMHSRRRAPTWC